MKFCHKTKVIQLVTKLKLYNFFLKSYKTTWALKRDKAFFFLPFLNAVLRCFQVPSNITTRRRCCPSLAELSTSDLHLHHPAWVGSGSQDHMGSSLLAHPGIIYARSWQKHEIIFDVDFVHGMDYKKVHTP